MCIFSVLIFVLINWYDDSLSFRWNDLKMLDSCLGRCLKCLPFFNKLIHYIVLILVLILGYSLYSDVSCPLAIHYDTNYNATTGVMYTAAITYFLVDLFFFAIIQFLFSRLRHQIYWPNYMFEPIKDTSKPIKTLFYDIGPW